MSSWITTRALPRPDNGVASAQEFIAAMSRQRQWAVLGFATIFGVAVVFGWLLSERYEAHMEILVEQNQLRRAEPALSGTANSQPIVNQQSVTVDAELNSEIALLRSQSVLQEVVKQCGLDSSPGLWDGMMGSVWQLASDRGMDGWLKNASRVLPMLRRPTEEERTAKASRRLAAKLQVQVVKLSDIISVSYRSNDPIQVARVLNTLGDVYLKEHALAHHPPGELEFFQKETDEARAKMSDAEQKSVNFTKAGGVAEGQTELNDALKRLSDIQAFQGETNTAIASTQMRIHVLLQQASVIPQRQRTQMKTSDNGLLQQQLKSSLLTLQMKKTELLTKYQSNYPLVVEVDRQIAEARAALEDAQKSPVMDETTDRDPTYEMVREDLTRSQAELSSLRARSAALANEAASYRTQVQQLQEQTVQQGDLMRNAKAAEDNYLLLLHKEEEARISEQLDKSRIFNVSIVQPASVPVLPMHPVTWYLTYGCLLGLLAAILTAMCADRLDPTLRTTEEVELMLDAQVLAELPLPTQAQLPRAIKDEGEDRTERDNRILSQI